MIPSRKGDGTGLSVPGVSEVRKGDGTVLWSAGSAIPDSAIYRYKLDDVGVGITDSIQNVTATNNGITSISGDYQGGSAGDGDGASYIRTDNTLPDLQSALGAGGGIAFTVDNLSTGQSDLVEVIGSADTSFDNTFRILFSDNDVSSGDNLGVRAQSGGNSIRFGVENPGIFDGGKHRVFIGFDPSLASGNQAIFIDGQAVTVSGGADFTDTWGGTGTNWGLFNTYLSDGTAVDPGVTGVLDDVIAYNTLPDSTLADEDYQLQPWATQIDGGTDANTVYQTVALSTNAPKAISLSGDYGFVVGEGLSVVDVSAPETASEAATLSTTAIPNAYGITTSGNYAFVSEFADNKLFSVDISDPSNPSVVAEVTGLTNPRKVTIDGNYAFVTSGQNSTDFYSVDITDPTAPTLADTVTNADFEYSFESAIIGSTALVCGNDTNTLVSVDISSPTAMTVTNNWSDADLTGPYGIVIDTTNSIAYITNAISGTSVQSVDVSDPNNPAGLGVLSTAEMNNPYGIDIYSDADHIVTANRDSGYVITIDVTDATNMTQVAALDTGVSSSGPYDAAVSGGYTFTAVRASNELVVSGVE